MTTKRRIGVALAGAFCLTLGGAGAWARHGHGDAGGARGPLATYSLPTGAEVRFEGRVVERLAAGSYVYLHVEREAAGRTWVVTLASSAGAAPGVERVRIVAMGHADHFESKRLSRAFDDLYFAVVRPT